MSNIKRNAATLPFLSPPAYDEREVEIFCAMHPYPGAAHPYDHSDYMCATLKRLSSSFSTARNAQSATSIFHTLHDKLNTIVYLMNSKTTFLPPGQRFWTHDEWDDEVTIDGNTFNPELPPEPLDAMGNPTHLEFPPPLKCSFMLLEASYIRRHSSPNHEINRAFITFDISSIPAGAEIISAIIRLPWIWPDSAYWMTGNHWSDHYEWLPRQFFDDHPYPPNNIRVIAADYDFPIQLSDYGNVEFVNLFHQFNSFNRYLYYTPENIKYANSYGREYIESSLQSGLLKLAVVTETDLLEDNTLGPEPPETPSLPGWHYNMSDFRKIYGHEILAASPGSYVGGLNYHINTPAPPPSIKIKYRIFPDTP